MTIDSYYNPVHVIFGIDTLKNLSTFAKKYAKNNKILIVSDKNLLDILDIRQTLMEELKKNKFEVQIFEKEGKYSSIKIIDRGSEFVRKENFGLIVGIGGGSAMDTAKCMAILGTNKGKINLYLKQGQALKNDPIPLIQVPTTAGTGSEVTKWATVWDISEDMKKFSLSDSKMFAKAAILDPSLLLGLPPSMTAMTGIDALSQAIEAYWSKNHNSISDIYALQAISLILNNLVKSNQDPKNINYRIGMSKGSLLSGLAFSNTKTTAVHSVSYPMTLNFNIPHGLACGLTLGEFLIFNSEETSDNMDYAPMRIQKIVELFDTNSAEEAAKKLTTMMKSMGLKTRLGDFGIDDEGIEKIIQEGFTPDRVKHNPRLVTEKTLKEILLKIK